MSGKDGRMEDAAGDRWSDRLSEYVDEELTADERVAIERHLAECAACRLAVDELREVAVRASAMRVDSMPESDLWPAVADRLTPRRRLVAFTPRARRRRGNDEAFPSDSPDWRATLRRCRPALAAAAVLVLTCLAGVLFLLRYRPGDETRRSAETQPAPPVTASARPYVPSPADREYDDTIATLRRTVRERLTHDPHVVDVIEQNLTEIDAAIDDYRTALETQPSDRELSARFEAARQRKLDVLRRAAILASEGSD